MANILDGMTTKVIGYVTICNDVKPYTSSTITVGLFFWEGKLCTHLRNTVNTGQYGTMKG